MTSGELGSRRRLFDPPGFPFDELAATGLLDSHRKDPLGEAIARTRDYLLEMQHPDGHWVGELEGDTILESEYILLLAYLGQGQSEAARLAANYMLTRQLPDGGWGLFPGAPLEISASVKAYFALKIAGHDPQAEYMVRAKNAILAAGGAEQVNSFTRYYLALLGVISYEQCPAVPPELILIPNWCPFNIYEMSAWSRTIIIPLSLLWAFRPVAPVAADCNIRELFRTSPEELPVCMPPSEQRDGIGRRTWIDWRAFFSLVDRGIKLVEKLRLRPLRSLAVRRAADWMLERFENSDGLGAIFPPIIWSVVALKCLGYADDSPEVLTALNELQKLWIREGHTLRLQPCKSPVWDTAIATIALREAGVPRNHPSMTDAVNWLLSKEVRQNGDWTTRSPGVEPAGWYFEYNNDFYPDVDDTGMVLMALARCLPSPSERDWTADFLVDDWSPHAADRDAAAVVSSRHQLSAQQACEDIETMKPVLMAIWRGAKWILAMQSRDGGWGAFDKDNTRAVFTQVPFADHNAMIDPSTADLTARMLEMFGLLQGSPDHPAIQRALEFVWKNQEPDFSWYGRWGVNYLYGTWQSLLGLTSIGIPPADSRIRRAAEWLKSKQQPCGGWGETPRSYDDPSLRGTGPVTASQTAWALMGLLAAGEADSPEVARGVDYLLETQKPDGTWDEEWYTGTGFPKVFYLKYHLYRIYFPLMALARYDRLRTRRD